MAVVRGGTTKSAKMNGFRRSLAWAGDRFVHLPESLLAQTKFKYVSATSLPISGGRVPGEARETRRGMERLENQEKTSEQDAKKLKQLFSAVHRPDM